VLLDRRVRAAEPFLIASGPFRAHIAQKHAGNQQECWSSNCWSGAAQAKPSSAFADLSGGQVRQNVLDMRLAHVNIGEARPLQAKPIWNSGIFKEPVAAPVAIGALGLAGDAICDVESHGGPDQAVYVYGVPDYEWWSRELGIALAPGTFGENLTITDLESAQLAIGDRLHIGDEVVLEITAPRIPCVTLAVRMNDPKFVVRFRQAQRPGVYCRVITSGTVEAGESVRLEAYRGERLLAVEVFNDFFENRTDAATLRRHLAAPIAIRDRQHKEHLLRELL
jgi:MOSC domain-containing protein YiiM